MIKKATMLLLLINGLQTAGYSQDVALKTNGLYWLTTTPNIGIETALSDKVTLEATAAYNPWTFKDDRKMHLLLVQPELKYWFCEKFEGHFVGVHLHGAQFYGGFGDKLYDGYLAGGGLTYGYDWILSPHWNMEAAIGAGFARLWYKESPNLPCIKCQEHKHKNYIGPTKAALSLVYIF